MTRRGSLVYYLAAWVCGCLFASFSVWIALRKGGPWFGGFGGFRGFFFLYFLCLWFGVIPALLFALILRILMSTFRWRHIVSWLVAGAGVAPLLVMFLIAAERVADPPAGPEALRWLPIFWLTIPVGAATGLVLSLIQRAFEPRPEIPPQ
jgi:hypothetical protein